MDDMLSAAYRVIAVALAIAALSGVATRAASAQAQIDVYDLADYRLTPEVFKQFAEANRLIGDIVGRDPAFRYAPLFTKEIALSGDAPTAASGLVARLENHAGLTAALDTAQISAREYAKFMIALVGAHMAHGFLESGVLKRVPEGAPTINVEFVKSREAEVTAALAEIGIRD
jgi:hypothetical protein